MKWYWWVLVIIVALIVAIYIYEKTKFSKTKANTISGRIAQTVDSCTKPKTSVKFGCPIGSEKTEQTKGASQTFNDGLIKYACKETYSGFFVQPIVIK